MHGKNNRHGVEEMEEIHLFNEQTYVELVNMKCCYEGRGSPEILSACFISVVPSRAASKFGRSTCGIRRKVAKAVPEKTN